MTSSNVWLSLLETPSWGWPPFPFLSLSLKHVPSKSPSLQTPPVEPSPGLLPRRPTFLRLAALKGPAQARTQIPPHVLLPCTFRRPETHKDTVGHSGHLCTQEVAHGAHLTLGSQTSTNTAMSSPAFPHSASHRLRSTHSSQHTVLTDTHKHNRTRALVVRRNKCKPRAYCLPAQRRRCCHRHPRHRCHRHPHPGQRQHSDTTPVPVTHGPARQSHTTGVPCPAAGNHTDKGSGARRHRGPTPGTSAGAHTVMDTRTQSQPRAAFLCARTATVPWAHADELPLTTVPLSSHSNNELTGAPNTPGQDTREPRHTY